LKLAKQALAGRDARAPGKGLSLLHTAIAKKRAPPAISILLLAACVLHATPAARAQTRGVHATSVSAEADPARYVNTFVGTDNDGNTFPGATQPFGMVQWSPDTTATGWYKYPDAKIRGFSLTHFSGAGCPAYADFPFMPAVGPVKASPGSNWADYAAPFSHDDEQSAPGYYAVRLGSGVNVELTTTMRTGFGVFTFPATTDANVLVNAGGSATGDADSSVQVIGDRELAGSATSGRFCDSNTSYTVYFIARFERPFKSFGTWQADALKEGAREERGKQSGALLTFDAARERTVKVRVGLSFTSVENARLNLRTENDGWNFEVARAQARATWNDWLGRIGVEGGREQQQRIFYTALYHALLHPNVFSDVNGDYAGFDRAVHNARGRTQYANFSDWDTYRTVVQLHALLAPRETSDMMQSLVEDARQSGWLPKWPMANDVTAVMGGDNPAPLITTAYAFGARRFDARAALAFMLKAATRPGTGVHGYAERPRLAEYLERGYVPLTSFKWDNGMTGATSASLEYVTDDFCVAQLAAALGDDRTRAAFMRRAQNWQTLFDPEIGFIRPRRANGVFLEGFDPDAVLPHSEVPWDKSAQAGFEEGNTWQYTWMIPHNYRGLFAAVGGDEEVTRRLDRFFTKLVGWGQPYFNIGNEPSFVAPYAYAFAGSTWRTQGTVRRIMDEIYRPTPAGLPGNDDLGATSAWYVWGALGLYPAIPAVGGFVISSPLFPAATVRLGDGRRLRIEGEGASADNPYVRGLTMNGEAYTVAWLPLALLGRGTTTLHFKLSGAPNTSWPAAVYNVPPSFTEGQAPILFFIRGEDSLTLPPGGEATITLGARRLSRGPLVIKWSATTVSGGLRLVPSSGTFSVSDGEEPQVAFKVLAGPAPAPGSQTVHVRLEYAPPGLDVMTPLPEVVAGIKVSQGGTR
jgi:predicted alpha-1,2-mannosidase